MNRSTHAKADRPLGSDPADDKHASVGGAGMDQHELLMDLMHALDYTEDRQVRA